MSKSLVKSTATVGGMTSLSRVLGLVRDIVLARVFGAGVATDVFFVVFRIPNFLRRLFAEGAFSQAFVPVLSEYKTRESHAEVRSLVSHVFGNLGLILVFVTLISVILAPVVMMIFAPGFINDESKYGLAVEMFRIMFPYLLFISLTSFAAGILNTYNRFGVPAFTPVILNVTLIIAALVVAPYFDQPVKALAWGVLFAGVAQLLFQLPFLYRLGLLPKPRFSRNHAGVNKIKKLMLPALFGTSVVQVNLLFDTLIASFLVTGSVSWLYFSDRLVEFPLGVFGVALATVILPNLSKSHAEESAQNFNQTLDWGLRWVFLIGAPAMIGLMVLAPAMIMTLFFYGEFEYHAVLMSSWSLLAYASGLLPFILIKVLAPGFYARQDTKTPVKIGVISMVGNMVLNIIFVLFFIGMDFQGAHVGLALATSLSAFLNAWLLFRQLKKEIYQPNKGWRKFLIQILTSTTLMGLVLFFGVAEKSLWVGWNWMERSLNLGFWVIAGAIVYVACLWVMGVRPHQLLRQN